MHILKLGTFLGLLLSLNLMGEPLKVFICAGQSNMRGSGAEVSGLPEELKNEQKNLVFASGEWKALSPKNVQERGFGPELSFAAKMSELMNEEIGIIKLAVGGTNLAQVWDPEAELPEKGNRSRKLYPRLVKLFKDAQESKEIEIIGMIWMQGEADSKNEAHAKAYKKNLEALVAKARVDFSSPKMPFVAGRVNPVNPKKYLYLAEVRKAQETAEIENYALVDCDDLEKLKDKVHYNHTGTIQLGENFAIQMKALLEKAR